jgi:hypothetical protein
MIFAPLNQRSGTGQYSVVYTPVSQVGVAIGYLGLGAGFRFGFGLGFAFAGGFEPGEEPPLEVAATAGDASAKEATRAVTARTRMRDPVAGLKVIDKRT